MVIVKHYPLGDLAIVLSFGDNISEAVNAQVRRVAAALDTYSKPGILEYVPAYTTITIYYDPLIVGYEELFEALQNLLENTPDLESFPISEKEIPVYYNGPDLPYVAQQNGLSEAEVIQIHSEREYLVYMMGFVPGFPYLGGMDSRIATARKQVPRLKIEAGAVGIAGEQTGVYPIETPGGWQIIGHTPLQLFDRDRDKPSFLEAGDRVRFVPIDKEEFDHLKEYHYGD